MNEFHINCTYTRTHLYTGHTRYSYSCSIFHDNIFQIFEFEWSYLRPLSRQTIHTWRDDSMSQSSINFSLQFEKRINEIFDEFFEIIDNRKNVTWENDYVKELLTDCQAKCLNYVNSVFNLRNDMSTNTIFNQNASTSQISLQQNITTNSTFNKDEKNESKSS